MRAARDNDAHRCMDRLLHIGRRPSSPPTASAPAEPSDWEQAHPGRIQRALERALAKPSGGWFVVDASRAVTASPRLHRLDGRELVVWRANGRALVAPNACPHMGASLAEGSVRADGKIVCAWHGLALGDAPHGGWKPYDTHDDGVLVWARVTTAEPATEAPILAPRPRDFVAGVIRMQAACEPSDVIANRLDPWHGAHFHPHSFADLRVTSMDEDVLRVRVTYRVLGKIGVEVDATFHCPEPRTIVMTIVEGEGVGSVVETHATPLGHGRTAIIEATLATSDRQGFRLAMRAGSLLRPLIERRSRRLWVEDAAYAERRYALRKPDDGA